MFDVVMVSFLESKSSEISMFVGSSCLFCIICSQAEYYLGMSGFGKSLPIYH